MAYQLLKDKVTHFSSQLKLEPQNLLDVTVGGQIKEIYPPLDLYIEPFIAESTGEEIEGVDFGKYHTILVDDGLGELAIYISKELYEHHKDIIEKDNVCIFKGLTNTLTRKVQGEHVVELRIYAYDIQATTAREEVTV